MSGHDSYSVTAECFAFMTQELGRLADGRIMISLEGGYNLVSLSQGCDMCIRSLLGEQVRGCDMCIRSLLGEQVRGCDMCIRSLLGSR